MHKRLWQLVIMGVIILCSWLLPTEIHAQTSATHVMLVYDSRNVANNDQTKIAMIQRILTGLHISIKTVAAEDYHAGELRHYQGVITLINWPQTKLNNAAFIKDRKQFSGTKLHIGTNLTAIEAQQLNAQPVKVYQQQFFLQSNDQQVRQLLPFMSSMTALTKLPAKAKTIGYLRAQSSLKHEYPYGTIVGRYGYLPYLSTEGYSLVLATQTMATLFGTRSHYQPLLTITKVTPYSNLNLLNKLSATLYQQGIPFAVSTTTVGTNGKFKAYQRFAKVLRLIENRGGVIFLKTPVVGGVTASSGPGLSKLMDSYVIQLAQNQVYPVGISASAYWNQDRVYRQNALTKANQVLLLPDPKVTTYAHQDNQATVFDQAFYGVSAKSFETLKSGDQLSKLALNFAIPTALTMTMPDSETSLHNLTRQLSRMNYQWFDPAQQMTTTMLKSGTATISYRRGTYLLNGAPTQVTDNAPATTTLAAVKPAESWMNRFFKTQGSVLLIFFSVTLGIFVLFIVIGRRVYLNMFKPK
ncbi:hypothetical protein [Lactiplantibacillus plantarum]|uniref:hypothetical protein n=1 Tax=Lactiplantibacillus plantarum TaxID=1590 RepID=UPI003852CC77|nr:hypothetical protein [Lactiplantibacillus plantarum]